ncbi:MAG: hypothetical protein QOD76_1401 [Solirubrobacteraceae bacterium]|nr:hypothetical protein [Solirubrobacteraceae bacterium]
MDQLPPIDSSLPGAYFPGRAAEHHLRRAAELTAELIDLVAEVRAQLDGPRAPEPAPPDVEPTARRGLARGEMRQAFAAARAAPRRQPREPIRSPVDETDGNPVP